MNALILENDGGEQRTPRVSACEPLCAILPMSTGQIHREYFAPKYGGLRRTKEKQEKVLALSMRQGGDFCPQCGQLRGQRLTLFWRESRPIDADISRGPSKPHC